MLWLIFFGVVLTYIITIIKRKQSFWEGKGIKYAKPKFIVGNMQVMRSTSLADLVKNLYKQFPKER